MKKHFIFVVATLSILQAPARANILNPDVEDAVSKIVTILRPRMTLLDRETMTFHYATTVVEPQISSQDQIQDWAGSIGEKFFDIDAVSGDLQGVGFYVATDPHSSRSFGGIQNPLLFATPIKKGAMILNLRGDQPTDPNDRHLAIALIKQFGCQDNYGNQGEIYRIDGITGAFRNATNPVCRTIITEAYRRLGAQAILYSYTSDEFPYGCRSRGDAFNIIDGGAIANEGNALFWEQGYFSSKTFARLVAQTYRDAHEDFFSQISNAFYPGNEHFEIPGSLKTLGTFERSAQSWRKRHLLRCGPAWSIEALSSKIDDLLASMKVAFVDRETQTTIVRWFAAYHNRFKINDIDVTAPQRIRAIESKMYLSAGLPADFSKFDDWKKATEAFASFGDKETDRDRRVAQILGEPYPPLTEDELLDLTNKQIGILFNRTHRQPGLLGDVLKHIGYGPIVTTFKVNQLLTYYGGIQFVATPASTDSSSDEKDLVEKNRFAYVSILNACTAMMNDPQISDDAIRASDCAVRLIPRSGSDSSSSPPERSQSSGQVPIVKSSRN